MWKIWAGLAVLALHAAATDVIVHLMDWRFEDIASECEIFLKKTGYSAVLVSPVHEVPDMVEMPWYERYEVFSYNVTTRSGNSTEFKKMAQRCNKAGIKVYVEVVLNHMSTNLPLDTKGIGGSTAVPFNKDYPAIPFNATHFHPTCEVVDYYNASNVRKCELDRRHDLFQKHDFVRTKQAEFLNQLVDLGAQGFKLCNAKYMFPDDLEIILARMKKLPSGNRPFVFSDVNYSGKEAVKPEEYFTLGPVTEYKFERFMKSINLLERESNISALANCTYNLMNSSKAVINVDLMEPSKTWDIGLRKFRVFNAFMLAQPYGAYKSILSSYWLHRQDLSPPHYENKTIKRVEFSDGGYCKNKWNCEHRDPFVASMVKFSQIVEGTNMTYFTVHSSSNDTQISFCRPGKGFVAISDIHYAALSIKAQTCLPPGRYCNIVTGSYINKSGKKACVFNEVQVPKGGVATINFYPQADGIVALHIMEKPNNSAVKRGDVLHLVAAAAVFLYHQRFYHSM